MTVEFVRAPIPQATLTHNPDGSSTPFVLYFTPAQASLAKQYLAAHSTGGRP